eukprot:jgi/Astpho2/6736/Aster-x0290
MGTGRYEVPRMSPSANVQGEPRAQFYCHCAECARTHATHFVEVIAFQDGANAFKITSGEEMLQSYGTEKALRRFCKTCGSIVSVLNGTNGLIGTFPRLIEGWQFRPEAHFFTGQSQARLDHLSDGLPKFVDSSIEHGGTGKFHPSVAKWNRFEKPQAGTIPAQPATA